jgi:hypothetical protein
MASPTASVKTFTLPSSEKASQLESSKSLFKQMRVATGLANIGWFTWQRMIATALQLAGFHNG